MRSLGLMAALAVIGPLLLAPGDAVAAGLSAEEQAMLEELLGPGVVGESVAGGTLTASYAPLRAGTSIYEIVGGEGAGQNEQHVVTRLNGDPSGANGGTRFPTKGCS